MNFLMNFTYHAGIATALAIGGVVRRHRRIDVGR